MITATGNAYSRIVRTKVTAWLILTLSESLKIPTKEKLMEKTGLQFLKIIFDAFPNIIS